MEDYNSDQLEPIEIVNKDLQLCPSCGDLMGIMPGSRDAYCQNCGFKDPCCE